MDNASALPSPRFEKLSNILYRYLETIGRLALGIGARGTIQPGALLAARGLQEQPMATFLMA
jgi:hypothetical protein